MMDIAIGVPTGLFIFLILLGIGAKLEEIVHAAPMVPNGRCHKCFTRPTTNLFCDTCCGYK